MTETDGRPDILTETPMHAMRRFGIEKVDADVENETAVMSMSFSKRTRGPQAAKGRGQRAVVQWRNNGRSGPGQLADGRPPSSTAGSRTTSNLRQIHRSGVETSGCTCNGSRGTRAHRGLARRGDRHRGWHAGSTLLLY